SLACECTGVTEWGSSVTTDSIALTPGNTRAVTPAASWRTIPPSRRLWKQDASFMDALLVERRYPAIYTSPRSRRRTTESSRQEAPCASSWRWSRTRPTPSARFAPTVVSSTPATCATAGGHPRPARRPGPARPGGMIDAASARGVALVPSLAAAAAPAGRVAKEFYAEARDRLVADLRAAGPLDGVLLDLHGAMVVEGLDDGEGDLLQAVRATVGAVPIAVTPDFHANVTATMVRSPPLLHGYT